MEFFETRVFFGKINNLKMWGKDDNFEVHRVTPVCAPVSSSQWTQSDASGLKTVGGVGFWVPENVTF